MMDVTRGLFADWRAEIEAEIGQVAAELERAREKLQAALAAVKTESARIGDMSAAVATVHGNVAISNALRNRLAQASKPSPATASRGHAEAVAALEFRLADLQAGLAEVEALLRPRAPQLALVDDRGDARAPVTAASDEYDPIIMPTRRAV